jgi:hypothetical protein
MRRRRLRTALRTIYRIKTLADGTVSVAPEKEFYFPVFFSSEPKTSLVCGLDYSTDAVRWATLERARDSDAVAIVPTRLFKGVKGKTHGVMVGVPVCVKGTSRTTVADRRRNLAGFVIGIFDLENLLHSVRMATAASPAIIIDTYPPNRGDASWQVRAIPADGSRLITHYDRALIVLTAGIAITVFWPSISVWRAAIHASLRLPIVAYWSLRRLTY